MRLTTPSSLIRPRTGKASEPKPSRLTWLLRIQTKHEETWGTLDASGIPTTSTYQTIHTKDENSLQDIFAEICPSTDQLGRRISNATSVLDRPSMQIWPGTKGSFDRTMRGDDTRRHKINLRERKGKTIVRITFGRIGGQDNFQRHLSRLRDW